jgi:xanthine dehydrogenase molybdopterin binding subunit/xanthine dehydrogenase small subunit
MSDAIRFSLNGKPVTVTGASTQTTLLDWLRANGTTGPKEGCAEGDCGACSLAMRERDAHGNATWRSFCSCITVLPMVDGRELLSVEGLAEGGPHPVQTAMADRYGSQCGYCTPGFVMSMFEGYHRADSDEAHRVADQLCGNLCRCTGYRPIRDAMDDALKQRDKGDRFHLRLHDPMPELPSLTLRGREGERFDRPQSLDELLSLRAAFPYAVLVAGATEVGVELNKKPRAFPHLISTEAVAELHAIERRDGVIRIGGAATLTEIEERLGEELPSLGKMLAVFASRQVRNRATLAGNLVTASPIGDLAPVLMTFDAKVELASVRGRRIVGLGDFFLGYRKTAMEADEVMVAVGVPDSPPEGLRVRADSFKVSKRREMDISIVAGAFLIGTDGERTIRHARLAFGGVAATTVRAKATEAALIGLPFTVEGIRPALAVLADEFTPITDARGGADYRRQLIPNLFEKFVSGDRSLAQDLPLDYVLTPAAETDTDDATRALRHESGLLHATGAARYVDDGAQRRGMLTLWPVTSPHAHARITRRDATAARAVPGVAAVLFAEDIPGTNDVGAVRQDETLLAVTEVCFHGHIVAVVVADDELIARRAASLVVVEYEPLPAVLGLQAALEADSFHTNGHRISRGDVDEALARAPHRLDGTLTIGGQEHFYLESQAAWAEPGDEGDVVVHSSTQHPSEVQAVVSHVLHVARNKVVVKAPRMGGGFGGKETQGNTWAALVALAATKTGRAVRVQLDRDVDLALTGKRHPFYAAWEVGFDEQGVLLGAKVNLTSDGGWALDLSESICDRAVFHLDNAYYIPAVDFFGRVAKTNVCSHTAFRGFGGPQGMVVIEDILDRVARTLGLPPHEVRARNLYRGDGESNTTHYGELIEDNRLGRIWPALLASSDFLARRAAIAESNAQSARIKRGIAITPVKFGISFTATFLNQAGALLHLYRDGSLQVNHGGTEMGQGLHTKVLGIAMRELGLGRDAVRVMHTATDKVPNTSATAASAGADLNGAAVRDACVTLRERLRPIAAALLDEPLDDVRWENGAFVANGKTATINHKLAELAYLKQTPMSATGFYRTPGVHYDKVAGRGKPFHYFAFGAAVTEVEVDGYTGMKRVLRTDILHDVGDSLNPGVDRGQVEGGFVQGVGWLTGEELLWDPKGRLLTHSASTYQIPAFSDAPRDFRVTLLPDAAQGNTIHGSKAVGEPPLMLAISAREAIREAVAAFSDRPGVVPLASPATHEAILAAIGSRRA